MLIFVIYGQLETKGYISKSLRFKTLQTNKKYQIINPLIPYEKLNSSTILIKANF